MANEPSRKPTTLTQTAQEHRRRGAVALLQGSATLAAAFVAMALRAPKLPPLQGD